MTLRRVASFLPLLLLAAPAQAGTDPVTEPDPVLSGAYDAATGAVHVRWTLVPAHDGCDVRQDPTCAMTYLFDCPPFALGLDDQYPFVGYWVYQECIPVGP